MRGAIIRITATLATAIVAAAIGCSGGEDVDRTIGLTLLYSGDTYGQLEACG